MMITDFIAWLVAAVCFAAGVWNLLGSPGVRAEFARFGYPPYWHWVTGVLEILGAVLLIFPAARLEGAGLLGLVLIAALATILWHREFKPLVPCLALLAGLAYVIYA